MTDEELEAMHKRKKERTLARKTKKIRDIQKRRTIWFLFSMLIILLDQLSKWAVMEHVIRPFRYGNNGLNFIDWYTNQPSIISFTQIPVTSFFNIVMAWNTGVSFSLMNNIGSYGYLFLIFVALVITTIFAIMLWNSHNKINNLSYALVIGGALGNVIDRARFGAVIDFLDFHINDYHWPAFNLADMSVVSGIILLIGSSLFFERKTRERYRKNYNKRRKEQELHEKRFGLK